MNRNYAIYFCHALVVIFTAYLASKANVATWYMALLAGAPLILATFSKFNNISYTLNARIFFPISVGLLCAVFYHYVPIMLESNQGQLALYGIKNPTDGLVDKELFEVNPIFKDAVSVLYAICAAFLLWKGLSDFDELKLVLYEEANEVRSIADFTTYFVSSGNSEKNTPIVRNIRQKLHTYLKNMLEGNKIVASAENEKVLEDCLLEIGKLDHGDLNDQIALEEIMKSLNRISILRTKRTVCIEKRMSPFILGLMLIMSATMVFSFFGKATGEFGMDYIYVFLLPAFYTSIFMTLLDLSSPFDGYWSIKLHAVRGVMDKLDKQLGASPAPT